jgi:hypothetical protein
MVFEESNNPVFCSLAGDVYILGEISTVRAAVRRLRHLAG